VIDVAYRDAVSVDLPGGPIVLVRRGSGPPTIFLHGIPLSLLAWRHNIDQLSRTLSVLAIDMRGFGRSAKPLHADYSVQGHARVVEELITELDLPKVNVVGSSYGCAVAIMLAHIAPERVNRLVFINPVCYPGGRHSAAKLARVGLLATLARTSLRTSFLGKRLLASRLRHSFASFTQATPELIDAHHELLTRDHGEKTYLATLRQLDEDEVARTLPKLRQETLVIWGADDHVLPVANAHRMAAELPSSRLEILDGVGHFPPEETPDRVNKLIANFLGRPSERRSTPTRTSRRDESDVDVRVDGLGRARP